MLCRQLLKPKTLQLLKLQISKKVQLKLTKFKNNNSLSLIVLIPINQKLLSKVNPKNLKWKLKLNQNKIKDNSIPRFPQPVLMPQLQIHTPYKTNLLKSQTMLVLILSRLISHKWIILMKILSKKWKKKKEEHKIEIEWLLSIMLFFEKQYGTRI